MLHHLRLFALFALLLNACGQAPCPEQTCDDLVNVVFSRAMTASYTVRFEDQEHRCVDGQPSDGALTACSAYGFMLRTNATTIALEVAADGWSGQFGGSVQALDLLNETDPECPVPCRRAEVLMMVNSAGG